MMIIELGLQRKIFIGIRTDGQPGSGMLSDPFDGSTVDKFDAIMNDATKILPYSEIILLPGVFYTRGWTPTRDAVSWRLRPGCRLRGCGMFVTTLKLADASVPQVMYSMILARMHDFGARDTFFNPGAVEYYNEIELSDLTLDADFLNQPANAGTPTIGTHGIEVYGMRCKIERVRFIHFGSGNGVSEAFVCGIGFPMAYGGWGDTYNLTIDSCVFESIDYNTLPGGLTYLAVLGGESLPDGSQAWNYNVAIRNNQIDGKFSDGTIPCSFADPIDRKAPVGLQWGAGYNISVEGNKLLNGVNVYGDTWNTKFATVRNNQFWNVFSGVYLNYGGKSPNTGARFTIEKTVIENNDISLMRRTLFPSGATPIGVQFTDAFDLSDMLFKTLIVRGNRINIVDDSMRPGDLALGGIMISNAEDLQIEDNVIQLPNSVQTPSARGSIYVKKVLRLNARNNRRPEDNSIIVPWSADRGEWLTDESYELEKGMHP